MNFIGIIPARYASTRFPGKPLVEIGGKPMIQRVYEQASKVLGTVIVATDDERIQKAVLQFGGSVVMTSDAHRSGTDRLAEAIDKVESSLGKIFQVVLNIQGDEPFVQPEQLQQVMSCFDSPDTQLATLVKPVTDNATLFNANHVKVAINKRNEALYFSRSPIPYIRGHEQAVWYTQHQFFQHIGIYAYRTDVLREITQLEASSLEIAESLEQNRWLENGYKIKVAYTDYESVPVDTPEDLEEIIRRGLV